MMAVDSLQVFAVLYNPTLHSHLERMWMDAFVLLHCVIRSSRETHYALIPFWKLWRSCIYMLTSWTSLSSPRAGAVMNLPKGSISTSPLAFNKIGDKHPFMLRVIRYPQTRENVWLSTDYPRQRFRWSMKYFETTSQSRSDCGAGRKSDTPFNARPVLGNTFQRASTAACKLLSPFPRDKTSHTPKVIMYFLCSMTSSPRSLRHERVLGRRIHSCAFVEII